MPANKKYDTEEERKGAIRASQRKRNKDPKRIEYMREYKKNSAKKKPEEFKELCKEYSKRSKENLINKIGREEYNRRNRVKSRERRESNRELHMFYDAKKRAKKKDLDFNIEVEDIVIPEFCPILGLKLEHGKGGRLPTSPSLDRIDNNKGYVKGNVKVISYRANQLKNDATFEEMLRILDYLENPYGMVWN